MKSAKIIIVLTVIGVFSGALLAGVFSFAEPLIEDNARRALKLAVTSVVPGSVSDKKVSLSGIVAYKGLDNNGKLKGWAVPTEFPGFQGKIKVMVGVDPSFKKVRGLVVLESVETPGLGDKIKEAGFLDRFKGMDAASELTSVKNAPTDTEKNQVEAITGATISSRAVVEGASDILKRARQAWIKRGEE